MPALVLIVDDAWSTRFALRDFLEHAGYAVGEAGDVRTARQALADDPPQAVLLDHHLPDGTSLDLLPDLKGLGIPVIVLTGNPTNAIEAAATKLGAGAFLHKPVDLATVRVTLERLLHDSDKSV